MRAMILKCAAIAAVTMTSTGCTAFLGPYPTGFIFDSSIKPHPIDQAYISGPGKTDDKMGEACSTGFVFGAVSIGDASLAAAKKAGGITDVHTVDVKTFSIIGVYTQGCTIVHGK